MRIFKLKPNKKPKKTILIDSCSRLTIFRYLKILESNDLSFLVAKGPIPSDEVLQQTLDKILQEFNELKKDKNKSIEYDKIQYFEQLKIMVSMVFTLANTLEQSIHDQLIDENILEGILKELKRWGFPVNRDNPINQELEIIHANLKAYYSTIEILKTELFPDNPIEDESETKNKVLAFYDMLINYQRILEIDRIDVKKTSLLELVAIEKQVLQRIESQKRNLNKNT